MTREDRERLVDNLMEFIDQMNDLMDLADVMHLFEQWDQPNGQSVIQNQAHLDKCPACKKAYATLVRGTDLAFIPIIYEDETIVVSKKPKGRRYANRRIIN